MHDALALGYRGVEADFFLVRGQLLVAHDRRDVDARRTLEGMYLRPLRDIVARCGRVLPYGEPFLLNIEAKTKGPDSYHALMKLLARYQDMLTVVRDGVVHPGPIQVVLVGWHPPLEELAREPMRLAAVQWKLTSKTSVAPSQPAHLVRLVSLDYGKTIRWSGQGRPPARARGTLARLMRDRNQVPGRIARVYDLPANGAIYRWLLDSGVDLIGAKNLDTTRSLLAESTP